MNILSAIFLLHFAYLISAAVNEKNCEVCVKFVRRLKESLTSDENTVVAKIEEKFKKICKTSKGKDESLCYYIGGLETSATYIVKHLSEPLSWGMPEEKVCEKLKAIDSQICELKYDKPIDLTGINLNKARVKDLKKILEGWGVECKGCTEKSDYIRLINEKMPIHDPKAAEQRSKSDL